MKTKNRLTARIIAMLVTAVALACIAAPSAVALEPVDEGLYTVKLSTAKQKAIDVSGASDEDGAVVQIWADNQTPAQRWTVEDAGDGYVKLLNVNSEKALDVAGADARAGARVQQYEDNGTNAQRFKPVAADGGFILVSALSDKLALGLKSDSQASGTQLCLVGIDSAAVWSFNEIKPVLANGTYTLTCEASGKVLDVSGASLELGANAQQWAANETMAQSFALRYDNATGYYTVIASYSGYVLDVAGAGVDDGTNVWMYASNNTRAQKWAINANGDGTVTLRSAIGGGALDISGASASNGANAQVWTPNGTDAQKWTATAVDNWLPDGVYNIIPANNTDNHLTVESSTQKQDANIEVASAQSSARAQRWIIVEDGDSGYYTIRNLNSRRLLTVEGESVYNGANVVQGTRTIDDTCLWSPSIVRGGIVFRSKLDSSYVVDIAGGSTSSGANVWAYEYNGTSAQKFRLTTTSDAPAGQTFTVWCASTNTVLDVEGGSKSNGAAVQLYESNGTKAQAFTFKSLGGNEYALVNPQANKAIEADSKGIRIWEGTAKNTQHFKLAFDINTGGYTIISADSALALDGAGGKLSLEAPDGTKDQLFVLTPAKASTFKVYINAGHGWGSNGPGQYDPGAGGDGYVEAEVTDELAGLVIDYARSEYGLDVVDGRPLEVHYQQRLNKAVELGCSAILSIHFDAGGGNGSMSMVGVSERHPASLTFDDIIHEHLLAGTGLPDLGTTYRDDIYCVNGPIPAVLVEVCFLDNNYNMQVYEQRKHMIARELAAALYESSLVEALNN